MSTLPSSPVPAPSIPPETSDVATDIIHTNLARANQEKAPQLPTIRGVDLSTSNGSRLGTDPQRRRVFSDGVNGILGLGRRSKPSRSSGGFLLESVSGPSSKKRRTDNNGSAKSSRPTSGWWSNDAPSTDVPTPSMSSGNHDSPRNSGGFKGKGRALLQPSPAPDTASGSLSNSTPTSKNLTPNQPYGNPAFPTLSVDQNQLVHMALSLSESRRLLLGPGHLASVGRSGHQRSISGGFDSPNLGLQDNFTDRGGSYHRSSQHYRSISMASPRSSNVGDYATHGYRPPSYSWEAGDAQRPSMSMDLGHPISEATIMRAEKARLHFELSHEYRRLLNSLPPLKSHIKSNHEQRHGRAYNPLQYIRNRQVRARQRQFLDAGAAGWSNLEAVRLWVDVVEIGAQDDASRSGDVQILPSWNSTLRNSAAQSVAPWAPPEVHDANTMIKPKWERLDWSVSPADLLADAYWLEQGRNKALVEFSDGSRIYDHFNRDPEKYKLAEIQSRIEENRNHVQPERAGSPDSLDSTQQSPPRPQSKGKHAHLSHSKPLSPSTNGPVARVKRHLLHLHKDEKQILSESEASDIEEPVVQHFHKRGSSKFDNTGPLEKHMREMLASETIKSNHAQTERAHAVDQEGVPPRRGGVSEEIVDDPETTQHQRHLSSSDYASARGSVELEHLETPRISIEDTDAGQRRYWNSSDEAKEQAREMQARDDIQHKKRSRTFPLNFRRKDSKLIEQEHIDQTDFALKAENETKRPSKLSRLSRRFSNSPRSSLDVERPRAELPTNMNLQKVIGNNVSKSQTEMNAQSTSKNSKSVSKRFFKGGRIGDVVGDERPRPGGFVWKRQPQRQDTSSSYKQEEQSSNSDAEDYSLINERDPKRSRSANDLSYGTYNGGDLPHFVPTRIQAQQFDHDAHEEKSSNHPSNQKWGRNVSNIATRSNQLETADSETNGVSPSGSSRNLSRINTTDRAIKPLERLDRNFSPKGSREGSASNSPESTANKRLKAVFGESGSVSRSQNMATPLKQFETSWPGNSYPAQGHHHWSIADGTLSSTQYSDRFVMQRDIAYVGSLLLSTGIKAKTIVELANTFRDKPPPYLTEAARLCNASVKPVMRREEHVIAARLLSSSLESSVSAFEEEVERFRGETCTQLHARIDDLREKVGSKLTPLVRACADDSDAFIARLTTTHTLAIKQVNDSVDLMMRSRRRRLRWLRRAGFKMLEWVVVGILWWIWLFVSVLKAFKSIVIVLWRGVSWMFWP